MRSLWRSRRRLTPCLKASAPMSALDLFMALQTPVADGGGAARASAGRQTGPDGVFAGLLALAATGTRTPEAPQAGTPSAMAPQPDTESLDFMGQAKPEAPVEAASPNPDPVPHPTTQSAEATAVPVAHEDAEDKSGEEIKAPITDQAAAAVPTPAAPAPVSTDEPEHRRAPDPAIAAADEMADQAGDGAEPPDPAGQAVFQPAATDNPTNDPRGAPAAAPKAATPEPGVQAPVPNVGKPPAPDAAEQPGQPAQPVETAAPKAAERGTAFDPAASTAQPAPQPLPAEAGRRPEAPFIPKTAPERSGDARPEEGRAAPAATPDGVRAASSPPSSGDGRNAGQGPSSGAPGAGGSPTAGPGRPAPAEALPAQADAATARSEPPPPDRTALPVMTPPAAAQGPAPAAMTGLARATLETTAMMAAQIVRRLESRSTRFDMALTPEGLGRVDVRMEIDGDGQLTARLAFDNPAAAAELRGRVDDLRRQLEASGFQISEDALEFAEREGGRDQPFDRRFADRECDRAFAGAGRLIDNPSVVPPPTRWTALTLTPEGVDMKV